tara:strand:+ start:295 stop:420 length:126 start_codon:yes stop_codon:yes gene_type:complete
MHFGSADLMEELQYYRLFGRPLEPDVVIQALYIANDAGFWV